MSEQPTQPMRLTHPIITNIVYPENSCVVDVVGPLPYYEGQPVKITVKAATTLEFPPERLAMWGREGRKLIVKFEPPVPHSPATADADLLAACKAMLAWIESQCPEPDGFTSEDVDMMIEAEAAIAEAEGHAPA